jgi:type I restriction enzyme S subunit
MTSDHSRSAWRKIALKDLVDERGVTYGVVQPGQPRPDGVPIVRVNNFAPTGLQLDDVMRIDPEIATRHTRSRLRGGEVLITLVGSTGQVAVAPHAVVGWNVTRAVGVVPVRGDVSPRWVVWCLQGPEARSYLEARLNTTVQKTLNLRDLASLMIPVPPLEELEAITAVLGALDDKIESNRQLAGLVEETGARLFRARFVDFVAVEEFDDSEIGRIPRGWRAGALTDLARFVNGKAFTKHANGAGRPILRIRELNTGVDQGTPHSDIEAEDDFIARSDDILFAWSGSLGAYRWPGDESLINQHIFKVIPDGWPAWFVSAWIKEHMETFRAIARDKATTMGHIQRRHLAEARLALPGSGVVTQADAVIGPLDRQRAALVSESRTLRLVRDALLPKIISGQIRVPATTDPAEVIEPAVEALQAAAQ